MPFSSAEAMDVITHPDVDAVWICSPSQFHADQVDTKSKRKRCITYTVDTYEYLLSFLLILIAGILLLVAFSFFQLANCGARTVRST